MSLKTSDELMEFLRHLTTHVPNEHLPPFVIVPENLMPEQTNSYTGQNGTVFIRSESDYYAEKKFEDRIDDLTKKVEKYAYEIDQIRKNMK